MVKIVKTNNQFRANVPPDIMIAFNLDISTEYDWVSIGGLPALRVRK